MRLLIHAAGIISGGGLRHLIALIPALCDALPASGGVWLICRRSVAAALPASEALHLLPIEDELASSVVSRVPLDNLWVPHVAKSVRASVLVSFANFGPATVACPHVVLQTNALYFDPAAREWASLRERVRLALRRRLARATMGGADLIVTPSIAMADLVSSSWTELEPRLRVLPNGRLDVASPRMETDRAGDVFRFIAPGLGPPHKGLDILVEATSSLRDCRYQVRALASDRDWPGDLDRARRRLASLGTSGELALAPEVDFSEMARAYAAADGLVYPTLCESFGFTLLEALAAGVPIVASDLPVNRELAGAAALYYEPRSSQALARSMRELMFDAALRSHLSAAAQERAESFWTWNDYARAFLALCESVL